MYIQVNVQFRDFGRESQYPSISQSRNPSPSQGYPQTASTPWSALRLVLKSQHAESEFHLLHWLKYLSTFSSYAGPPLEVGLGAFCDWFARFTEDTSFLRALWEDWALGAAVELLFEDWDGAAFFVTSFPPLLASLLSEGL